MDGKESSQCRCDARFGELPEAAREPAYRAFAVLVHSCMIPCAAVFPAMQIGRHQGAVNGNDALSTNWILGGLTVAMILLAFWGARRVKALMEAALERGG